MIHWFSWKTYIIPPLCLEQNHFILRVIRRPRVKVPTLLIYSKDDQALPLGSEYCMNSIFNSLGTSQKKKLLLSGSGHVLTRDAKRQEVFQAAADFIKGIEDSKL